METYKLLNIEVFKWEEYDLLEAGMMQFYNPIFLLPELKQYDSCDVISVTENGDIAVYNGDDVTAEFNLGEIKSFVKALSNRFDSKEGN